MKMKPEHFDHMKKVIDSFLGQFPTLNNVNSLVEDYCSGNFRNSEKVKDLQMRFCFDVMHNAGLTPYVCSTLYSYLHDDHIYTALKKICPKVERKY